MTKRLHLLCNAHLDPAWLWEIEEGAGEALSTFRIAADFCERFDGFMFNHNEVILYEWIEEYDPALFRRIQRLVEQGQWHIMGGWYLQPDCNMPSGESFVRQMLTGRRYFAEKFGARPSTAINFDPFGHSRGLVQLLRKADFDSYIFCRPAQKDCPLPAEDFEWVGYDGSSVIGHRAYKAYLSGKGRARAKVESWLADYPDQSPGLVLWGIGNHGGGPSRIDLEQLSLLARETADTEIVHSTPEAYFRELVESGKPLPRHEGDLNAWAVGCYTSQIRIKQQHRRLENELFSAERMAVHAQLAAGQPYPAEELKEACRDLLVSQFHDMLPGSSVKPVEDAALRLLDHGLEIVSRLRARAFFALTRHEPAAEEGSVPVFVYNPHAYPVSVLIETELQLPESSRDQYGEIAVFRDGRRIPSQTEKELSSLYIEWRKRVVFEAELEPLRMNRFDCRVEWKAARREPAARSDGDYYIFRNDRMELHLNRRTGFIDVWRVDGADYVRGEAFRPLVMEDADDSWGSGTRRFDREAGVFKLMSPAKAMKISGLRGRPLPAVRVIEDGEVRTLVEALFEYGRSTLVMRYSIPKHGAEIRLDLQVNWNEPRKLLKLAVPTPFVSDHARYVGQTAYGTADLPSDGREAVAQKWTAAISDVSDSSLALTCINDGTYGSDFRNGEMRLSLLRSPGYSALPGGSKPETMPQDRYSPRMDMGERTFMFWFQGGRAADRLSTVDREAAVHNEKPFVLSYFPSGADPRPVPPLAVIEDEESVVLTAFKRAETSGDFIIRLFEPTGRPRCATLRVPILQITVPLSFQGYEVKTLRYRPETGQIAEDALMEGW